MIEAPQREPPDPNPLYGKTRFGEKTDKLVPPIALDVPGPFVGVVP